jgi:RNA polymerase sigma factor (sigma-70 family)
VVQQNDRTSPPETAATPRGSEVPQASPDAHDSARPELPESVCIAAIAGDQEALHRLWHHNRRWVAAIILAHKPRWADLEDLLQEVALSLVRKVGEVRDPRAVRPWLRTVAMNAAHAAARSGRRRARDLTLSDGDSVEQPFVGRNTATPPDQLAESEAGRRLLELARQLPDGYREPLLLKAVHNLSYREIGEILDMPETTVETRIARGRRQLRELALAAMP